MPHEFYLAQSLAFGTDYQFVEKEQLDNEQFVNYQVESVTVKDKDAADKWKAAYSRYIGAKWTPNQDLEERAENAKIIREALDEMKQLEQDIYLALP